MNVLSLFDGMSCGRLALGKAGIEVDNYYSSEIDKYAIKVADNNYPQDIQNRLGDVFTINHDKLKDISLIIGGSPCTFWSIARHKNKEVDNTGVGYKMFMEYSKALKRHNPKYFFYENNFGIHKDIQSEISKELGVDPITINSSLLSAQNRKRLYWTNIPFEIIEDKNIILSDILEDNTSPKLFLQKEYEIIKKQLSNRKSNLEFLGGIMSKDRWLKGADYSRNFSQGNRVYGVSKKSVCLTANGGGLGAKTGLYYMGKNIDNISCKEIRRLSPLECERLQTLPDNYTSGVSNSQRYKMLGNGWTVDVVAHIFKGLK